MQGWFARCDSILSRTVVVSFWMPCPFVLSGNGDVIEPDDGLCAIGSGGTYVLAAARALTKHSKLSTKEVAMEAMRIASEICIYTNANFTVEEI